MGRIYAILGEIDDEFQTKCERVLWDRDRVVDEIVNGKRWGSGMWRWRGVWGFSGEV
jgi:hypothetical protein